MIRRLGARFLGMEEVRSLIRRELSESIIPWQRAVQPIECSGLQACLADSFAQTKQYWTEHNRSSDRSVRSSPTRGRVWALAVQERSRGQRGSPRAGRLLGQVVIGPGPLQALPSTIYNSTVPRQIRTMREMSPTSQC